MSLLLHCTDFHGRPEWFHWLAKNAARYDAVVLSGDLIDEFAPPQQLRAQAARVTAFLEGFGHRLFVVSGNHDGALDLPAIAAHNPQVHVDGFDAGFLGWRSVCIGWRRAPALPPAGDAPVIFVSHQPPDETLVSRDHRGDWGGYDVRALAATLPAGSLVLSGHVHSPLNWNARVGQATALNPGVAPAAAQMPRHVVLDLQKRRARLVGGPAQDGQEVVAF